MTDTNVSYCRSVMAHLVCIEQEDDTMLRDLAGEGIEVEIRRAAVDGVITEMWNKDMQTFCKAMQIANVSAQQAAQVISAFTIIQGMEQKP